MVTLTIRTDNPLAEVGLHEGDSQLAYVKWEAHRQLSATIHKKIEELLARQGIGWQDIDGIIFFAGPGSFTGLRIGASVAGALAAGLPAPIISTKGEDWITEGINQLLAGKDEKSPVLFYGGQPHITKPKK